MAKSKKFKEADTYLDASAVWDDSKKMNLNTALSLINIKSPIKSVIFHNDYTTDRYMEIELDYIGSGRSGIISNYSKLNICLYTGGILVKGYSTSSNSWVTIMSFSHS